MLEFELHRVRGLTLDKHWSLYSWHLMSMRGNDARNRVSRCQLSGLCAHLALLTWLTWLWSLSNLRWWHLWSWRVRSSGKWRLPAHYQTVVLSLNVFQQTRLWLVRLVRQLRLWQSRG